VTSQKSLLDARLADSIAEADRQNIWDSAQRILNTHRDSAPQSTMGLGYVQSGKTTSIAALCALAADTDYKIIVAMLGNTNLLVDQNRDRLQAALGMHEHTYRWVSIDKFQKSKTSSEIQNWLSKGRVIFIPVIKNATQLKKLAHVLSSVDLKNLSSLIIDDEADQASLNTNKPLERPSSTYEAIAQLRNALPGSLYVQYTATPYAPLLLDPDDPLMPTQIEFLRPGTGYTGGKEFFIEFAASVLRPIPFTDEAGKTEISRLPQSLEQAIASYLAGAALLEKSCIADPPISMLIHATHRNDGQSRYHFLVERLLRKLRETDDLRDSDFADLIEIEKTRLYADGVEPITDEDFWDSIEGVIREVVVWLINSATDTKKISWNYSPFHILIGGNKLDRGFTVEGLTVTYMNRKASEQIDTLEQRARAFGYRRKLLPYCQLFASPRSIRLLQGIVHTEKEVRANLIDWIDEGNSLASWAEHVGLDLPIGAKPTRSTVVSSLRHFNADGSWHSLRRPNTDTSDISWNAALVHELGILEAPLRNYGRLFFRTLELPTKELADWFLPSWRVSDLSPSWRHQDILDHLRRHPDPDALATVMLMSKSTDPMTPRERYWNGDLGFINLFQGRDNAGSLEPRYEGDRDAGEQAGSDGRAVMQIHYVHQRGELSEPMFTLAINLGGRQIVRRQGVT